ncbi:MAG: DUF4375 domain-containing protein [Clostridia bacterium]|nr:DUF4375 domain-containing protein [Clostridia bacterium]
MKKIFIKFKSAFMVLLSFITVLLSSCGVLGTKQVHGDELKKLSDVELFETVYFQILDTVESFDNEEAALSQINVEQKTVYILGTYDMEIQNGGLCQFFVNSSRAFAPYVEDSLEKVGAAEHKKLFADFIENNNIDVNDLDSFIINDLDQYESQTKRYDFDSFDNKYTTLPELTDYITRYIKENTEKF